MFVGQSAESWGDRQTGKHWQQHTHTKWREGGYTGLAGQSLKYCGWDVLLLFGMMMDSCDHGVAVVIWLVAGFGSLCFATFFFAGSLLERGEGGEDRHCCEDVCDSEHDLGGVLAVVGCECEDDDEDAEGVIGLVYEAREDLLAQLRGCPRSGVEEGHSIEDEAEPVEARGLDSRGFQHEGEEVFLGEADDCPGADSEPCCDETHEEGVEGVFGVVVGSVCRAPVTGGVAVPGVEIDFGRGVLYGRVCSEGKELERSEDDLLEGGDDCGAGSLVGELLVLHGLLEGVG